MKREIKFRAWDKKLESMAKVISLSFYDEDSPYRGNKTELFLYYEKLDTTSLRSFDEIELMQYTGLKDKNSVEIYEDDIVKNEKGKVGYVTFLQQEAGYIVVTDKSDYRLGHRNTNESYHQAQDHEVIGNIHENPELLKGGVTC